MLTNKLANPFKIGDTCFNLKLLFSQLRIILDSFLDEFSIKINSERRRGHSTNLFI